MGRRRGTKRTPVRQGAVQKRQSSRQTRSQATAIRNNRMLNKTTDSQHSTMQQQNIPIQSPGSNSEISATRSVNTSQSGTENANMLSSGTILSARGDRPTSTANIQVERRSNISSAGVCSDMVMAGSQYGWPATGTVGDNTSSSLINNGEVQRQVTGNNISQVQGQLSVCGQSSGGFQGSSNQVLQQGPTPAAGQFGQQNQVQGQGGLWADNNQDIHTLAPVGAQFPQGLNAIECGLCNWYGRSRCDERSYKQLSTGTNNYG